MTSNTPDDPIPSTVLKSRFDNAHLVRIDEQTRLIAVWNGSQTINFYDFKLNEVQTGPYNVPMDEDGNPPSIAVVSDHIDDLFDDYTNE